VRLPLSPPRTLAVALSVALPFALGCAKDSGPEPAPATAVSNTAATATASGASAAAPPTATALSAAAPAIASDLAVGQPAPDFTASDQDGKPVHLAALKGHPVVVYFYPKDETPGCTKEACSFRDGWAELQKKGVVIIGISMDSAASHKAFATNHQLPFTLVSDSSGEIAAKYGVPVDHGFTKRESFVVGIDGTIKKIYRTVDVTKHAQEIAADTAS
jgi:peroxiredoxin Q/BCP